MIKICEQCNKTYNTIRKNQKYCSNRCSLKNRNKNKIKLIFTDNNIMIFECTGGKFIINSKDYDKIKDYTWHISDGYVITNIKFNGKYKTVSMQSLILKTDKIIDHKNRIRFDNRLNNLRECTNKENCRNTNLHRDSKTGYKGVTFDKCMSRLKRYKARIIVDGKQINLGLFKTREEAALTYNMAANKYFGKFSNVNIINNAII